MILHRMVIQAKLGKADDAVARLKQMMAEMPDEQRNMMQPRVLTDISGSFDTVVVETVHESLAAYETFRANMFARNAEQGGDGLLFDVMETGRSEFYTIEF